MKHTHWSFRISAAKFNQQVITAIDIRVIATDVVMNQTD